MNCKLNSLRNVLFLFLIFFMPLGRMCSQETAALSTHEPSFLDTTSGLTTTAALTELASNLAVKPAAPTGSQAVSIVERLILMNYRTEAPAVARKAERINSRFCETRVDVADAYEIDKLYETSHAAIGKRWLEFLIPDSMQRVNRIEETDLLRNVLLLTSFCHHGTQSMTELMQKYT